MVNDYALLMIIIQFDSAHFPSKLSEDKMCLVV